MTRCLRELPLDGRSIGVGAGPVLSRGHVRAEWPALHTAGVRVFGRPAVVDHLPAVGEDAIVEGRSLRGGRGTPRRAGGLVHRPGEALRRARPQHLGGCRGGGDLDRSRDGRVQQEERAVLRGLRPRRQAGALRVDATREGVRRYRARADRPRGRGRRARGERPLGRRVDVPRGVPSLHARPTILSWGCRPRFGALSAPVATAS